jgi:hypothetical protein
MNAVRIVINGTFKNPGKSKDDSKVYKDLVRKAIEKRIPNFDGEVEVEDVVNFENWKCDSCGSLDGEAVVKYFEEKGGESYAVCRGCVNSEDGERRFKPMKSIGKKKYLLWLIKDRQKKRQSKLVEEVEFRAKAAFKRILWLVSPMHLEIEFQDAMNEGP